MAFIAEMGVIAKEVELKETKNGKFVVEVPVFFNGYTPGVGKTTMEAIVTLWGDKAKWLAGEAAKHEKKDSGVKTNGKGMPMFFIGYSYTDKYENSNKVTVKQTRISVVDVLYGKVPVFQATGVIGTEVGIRTVDLKAGGKTTVSEIPVFFNGYVPGVGKASFETFVTLWGEKAEWLYEQAQKHEKKEGNVKTNGKGMPMDFVCYIHTHKYQNTEGKDVKVTKTVAADVMFPSGVFNSSTSTSNQTSTTPNTTTDSTPQETKTENQPPNDYNFELELSDSSGDNILGEFDAFLQEINKEQVG